MREADDPYMDSSATRLRLIEYSSYSALSSELCYRYRYQILPTHRLRIVAAAAF